MIGGGLIAPACLFLLALAICPARPAVRPGNPGAGSSHRSGRASGDARGSAPRLILAHYMPWFEADAADGHWGWHWTMNHFKPDRQTNGRQDIASRFEPLIGPYDSGDQDVLDYQVQLMKLAGIDGVVVDWYGADDFLDYPLIQRNTEKLVKAIERAGLHFAICYEDQSVGRLISEKRLASDQAVAHGERLMQWLEAHWFSSPAYLRLDGQPVLLVFGPQYYSSGQWRQIFASMHEQPAFFTLMYRVDPAVGAFGWPQPGRGTEASFSALDDFYARAASWKEFIPPAYPRFSDIYEQAGVGKSYGTIEDRAGGTFSKTLERALQSRARIVQLVTWNDWGEGTMIEPSVEFGYRDLETTQRLRRKYVQPSFRYRPRDLRLPGQLLSLRKKLSADAPARSRLADVSRLLMTGQTDRARALLSRYRGVTGDLKRR